MFLIIDGNNIAWAGYYGLERAMKPDTPERHQRVALLGLAGMALGAIARGGTPPGVEPERLSRVAICFDEGRPLHRRSIFPGYQMAREGDAKFTGNEPTILGAIREFIGVVQKCLPFEVLRLKNTEADDLIAGLAANNARKDKRIVSGDRDFLQLISARTSVYSPIKKVVIDESNFFDEAAPKTSSGEPMLFPRDRFLDYRTLVGDPSDSLPGVPGIGPLTAAKLVAAGSIESFFGKPNAVRAALGRRSESIERAFADGSAREIAARNRGLMDLRLPAAGWERLDEATSRGTWDRAKLEAWIAEENVKAVDVGLLVEQAEAVVRASESGE